MRIAIAACLSIAALLLSGCGVIDKELHNRGGYLDYLADTYWFKADSKKMRALRAFALEASLARIASVSPKNDQDRKLMAIRIGDATKRAQLVLQCAFVDNVVPVQSVEKDQCFFFDSLMVDYTTSLFDLALIAFPVDDVKNLIALAPAGIPDPAAALNLLSSLMALAKDALKYGRLIGAIYRDTVELEVQVWLATPDQDQSKIPPLYRIDENTVSVLKAIYDRGNDDLAAWQAAIAGLRAAGLEPIPDPKFIDEISFLISYLCGQITSDTDTGTRDVCKPSWLKGIPADGRLAMHIRAHESMMLRTQIPAIKVFTPAPAKQGNTGDSTHVFSQPAADQSSIALRAQLYPNGKTPDPMIVDYVKDILGQPPIALDYVLHEPKLVDLRRKISACIVTRSAGESCKSGSLMQFR